MAAKKPTFKLVLLGEVGVGKTSLFLRLKDGTFLEDSHASIGVDCCETAVSVEGEEVRLCVWDTAGVERFRTLTQGYYRHADAVLLVYSLPDSATLRMLTSWVREVNDRTV
ncbi:PREDICTED: ras-related protein Rab-18-like, partial [Branchiostoma belcheri]